MTSDEAKALGGSRFWEAMSYRDRAEFQLQEPLLCMPFDVFHEAVEKAIGRPVWTHEFLDMAGLLAELRGEKPPRTMQEILEMIPAEKRVVVVVPEPKP